MNYRVYVVGREGHFVGVHEIECNSDSEALIVARRFLDGVGAGGLEVWHLDRRVGRVQRHEAPPG